MQRKVSKLFSIRRRWLVLTVEYCRLPTVISTHSCRKPIMIFCCTRNSSVATAKELARLWSVTNPPARLWKGPNKRLEVHNMDLKSMNSSIL